MIGRAIVPVMGRHPVNRVRRLVRFKKFFFFRVVIRHALKIRAVECNVKRKQTEDVTEHRFNLIYLDKAYKKSLHESLQYTLNKQNGRAGRFILKRTGLKKKS